MSTKKEVIPRPIWSYQETEDLIDIIQAKFIDKILINKNCRKWAIFEEIREEMNKYGHDKSAQQIRFKYKNLLSMYRLGLQQKVALTTKDKRFEFFAKMCELFHDVKLNNSASEDSEDEDVRAISSKRSITAECSNSEDPLKDKEWSKVRLSSTKRYKFVKSKTIVSDDGENSYQDGMDEIFSESKKDTAPSNYVRCVDYLVKNFQKAQEDLQNKFYSQQLKLQTQQQEWEERMLDEEREFFSKVLKSHTPSADDCNF